MTVQPIELPQQRPVADGAPFPLVLTPETEGVTREWALSWVKDNAADLKKRMERHGAILFRGFPFDKAEDFEAMLDAAEFENMPYVGGAAPRQNITSRRVLTANESPPSEPIPFHHEMAQVPNPPGYVFFYCVIPPETGGETAIVHSNRVYERFRSINPIFAREVERKGVRYIRVMPDQDDRASAIGRSWRSTFLTDDRGEAESKMRELGTSWEWLPNGDLRTETATVPAIRVEPRTGMKTFFNSIVAAYTGWTDSRNDPRKAVCCGDGAPVDEDSVLATADAMEEEAVAIPWQRGDVLWVDNSLVLHARRPFAGARKILASIAIR